jgi:hypothetical protein
LTKRIDEAVNDLAHLRASVATWKAEAAHPPPGWTRSGDTSVSAAMAEMTDATGAKIAARVLIENAQLRRTRTEQIRETRAAPRGEVL